jgi:hypothetical protein
MAAAGGHLSTVDDLLRYLQFFISRGRSAPGVLSPAEVDYAISPLVPQQRRYQS